MLPLVDPDIFHIICLWLYDQDLNFEQYKDVSSQRLKVSNEQTTVRARIFHEELLTYDKDLPAMEPRWGWVTLTKLWILGQQLGMPKLQNRVTEALVVRVQEMDTLVKRKFGRMIWASEVTKRTPLRTLFLDTVAQGPFDSVRKLFHRTSNHADGFMADLKLHCANRNSHFPRLKGARVYRVSEDIKEIRAGGSSQE